MLYNSAMTTTVDAVYEGGKLILPAPLPLPEHAHVRVTILGDETALPDSERAEWLKMSEESLKGAWDNADDDIFNELLSQ